ncbi:MAG: hypothetical protein E6Z21_00860 [Anaerococcus vaginalis]|nr:hypothetical protein [Anaerococcus vaginalis]
MLERIGRISAEQGFLMTFAIVILTVLCYIIHTAMKDWQKQKELEREERKIDREIAREQNDKYTQIVANQATQIERATNSINLYQDELTKHTDKSSKSFEVMEERLDTLERMVEEIGEHCENLATREMVKEMSEEIKRLRSDLKKE